MKILWINDKAELTGGCEQYIQRTAHLLANKGCQSHLLYGLNQGSHPQFLTTFTTAFPAVNAQDQITALQPDLIYVHRLPQGLTLDMLTATQIPVVRFFHDHQLFCLREHKYTALTQSTCSQTLGTNCYRCLGFVQRQGDGLRLRTVGNLQAEMRQNQAADACIVASEYMAQHLQNHGFSPETIHVNPLYTEAQPQSGPYIPRDTQTLILVGQMVTGKGVDILLNALPHCRHTPQIKIIGSGRQLNKYQRLAQQRGLDTQVQFLGQQSRPELARTFQSATAVLVPSRAPETFGLVGLEAMQYACPVIAADVGGIREWLEPNQTGYLFPSGDSRALAKAIDHLLDHPAQARWMGMNGHFNWRNKFQAEAHLERLLALFQSLTQISQIEEVYSA